VLRLTDEQREFLLRLPAKTAKVATTRADGRPHVTPVWCAFETSGEGDTLLFTTGERGVKGTNLRREPRIALCIDDETPPFSFLILEGVANISDNLADLRYWAGRIAGRYMGEDRAEEYGRRNGVPGELLIRVELTHATFAKDIAL